MPSVSDGRPLVVLGAFLWPGAGIALQVLPLAWDRELPAWAGAVTLLGALLTVYGLVLLHRTESLHGEDPTARAAPLARRVAVATAAIVVLGAGLVFALRGTRGEPFAVLFLGLGAIVMFLATIGALWLLFTLARRVPGRVAFALLLVTGGLWALSYVAGFALAILAFGAGVDLGAATWVVLLGLPLAMWAAPFATLLVVVGEMPAMGRGDERDIAGGLQT